VTQNSRGAGIKSALWLTFFVALGWALCFWPARTLRGEAGVWWMSLAAIAVLVPGWIVVFLSSAAILRNHLVAMLVQTMIRLFSVAGTSVAVKKLRPDLGIVDFFGWLIAFYLLALAVEVTLLKRRISAASAK
jgi:hypothetical protein